MAVIDIIVICVLALFGIVGMVKGFLNTLISLFGNLASLAVAILCAQPVSKFLNNVFHIVSGIGGSIATKIAGSITPFQSAETAGNPITSLTGEQLKGIIGNDSFQNKVFNLFIENSKTFTVAEGGTYQQADLEVVTYIGEKIAAVIALVIAVVATFIVLRIAVLLLAKLFDAITKNRAISGLDRAMGLLFGLFKGALLVCLVLGVFYLLANTTVNGWVENSVVTKWIYQYISEFIGFIAQKYQLPEVITNLFPVLQTNP